LSTVCCECSPYFVMGYVFIFMLRFGLTLMPLVTISMSELDDDEIPHGSAINNTIRQFAMTFGIIVLTAIIRISVVNMDAPESVSTYWGTTYALVVMAVLAFAGFILTFMLKDKPRYK